MLYRRPLRVKVLRRLLILTTHCYCQPVFSARQHAEHAVFLLGQYSYSVQLQQYYSAKYEHTIRPTVVILVCVLFHYISVTHSLPMTLVSERYTLNVFVLHALSNISKEVFLIIFYWCTIIATNSP